jgi:ribA/ribD-fused uncharacterized protein
MAEDINFYLISEPFGEFSNFSRHRIWLDGKGWPTTEHYFQAMKFHEPKDQEEIRQARTPKEAAEMGRDRKRALRADWESVKDDVMRKAVSAKFSQHEDLKNLLASTGDARLVEHTKNDAYWADGGDGSGKNMLGRILMETRDMIKGKPIGD